LPYFKGFQRLDSLPVIKITSVKALVTNIVKPVAKLHDHHVCHNDLKGDNILVDEKMNIILIDYGLSTSAENWFLIF